MNNKKKRSLGGFIAEIGIFDSFIDAITSFANFGIDDEYKKARSKELSILGKKEPNIVDQLPIFYHKKSKVINTYRKEPKMGEQRYYNKNVKDNENV